MLFRLSLHVLEQNAGLDRQGPGSLVKRKDAVHFLEGQYHAAVYGNGTARSAGARAADSDSHACLAAELQDFGHSLSAVCHHDRLGPIGCAAGQLVMGVVRADVLSLQNLLFTDDGPKPGNKVGTYFIHHTVILHKVFYFSAIFYMQITCR